jgi:hypothetical protein
VSEQRPDIGQATEPTRHCDVCDQDIAMDELKPGWRPVQRDGRWVWSCPACSRTAGLL